jgi:hypothetical protein
MKQKRLKYKAIIFTMLSLLSIAQIANADENHLLAGTWSSKCASDDVGSFIIETFKFAGKSASYSVKTYSDSVCKKPISTLETYRNFKLGESTGELANNRKLDYIFKSVTMTFTDQSSVADANKLPGYYGFTNWKLNQPKEVSGLKRMNTSNPEHTKGEKFYTIVKIDKNKLYMGDYSSGAGTSDKTRLSTIYNIPFIKEDK